jgi:hypothetical protein
LTKNKVYIVGLDNEHGQRGWCKAKTEAMVNIQTSCIGSTGDNSETGVDGRAGENSRETAGRNA